MNKIVIVFVFLLTMACTVSTGTGSASTGGKSPSTEVKMPSTVTAQPVKSILQVQTAIVRGSGGLNVRLHPSTNSAVLCVISDGTRVLLTGIIVTANGTDWQPVTVGAVSGWVNSRYLEAVK